MSELEERLPRGPAGAKGQKGERGERGLPPGQRKAIVYLFAATFIMVVIVFAAFVRYVNSSQATARRQGLTVEQKICTTMGKLAALKPPPGSPQANPSRAFEQELHATLDQLGPDLGCR